MDQFYKNENYEDESKKEIFAQNYRSSNIIDDQALTSKIMKIQSMYYNSNIDDQFLKDILDIFEMVKKDKLNFILLLIKSGIIQFLFSIYQNFNGEIKLIVLNCLSEFSTLGYQICEVFLYENFISLFKQHFTNDNDRSDFYFIQIYYNILQSQSDIMDQEQKMIDQIIKQLPLREFYNMIQKKDNNDDILIYAFLCFNEIMKYVLDGLDNNKVIYEMIHHYFFEEAVPINRGIHVQNAFSKNCLSIISNCLYHLSFNYELFAKYELFQFVNFYLTNPPICNFSLACKIISFLVTKYNCDFPFDINVMITEFLKNNSEKNQFYSINSIYYMVHSNYLLSNLFFKDNCCLFFKFVDIFFLISSNSKSVLFKLIADLLDIATSAEWTLIFKEAIRTDENKFLKERKKTNHMCLFNIASQTMEFEELRSLTIIVLSNIFKKAAELNLLEQCYLLFNQVFCDDFEAKFDISDENVRLFLQTYFQSNQPDQ